MHPSNQKISSTEGNFQGKLGNRDLFGRSVTSCNDLNGDGVPDIAVGVPFGDAGLIAEQYGCFFNRSAGASC